MAVQEDRLMEFLAVERFGGDTVVSESTIPDSKSATILHEILQERERQDANWGERNHRDGTGRIYRRDAEAAKDRRVRAAERGEVSWHLILDEEVAEAYAEHDPAKLREDLLRVAAVAVAWAQAIDRRVGAFG